MDNELMERYDKEKKRLSEEKIIQEKEDSKKRWSGLKLFLIFASLVAFVFLLVCFSAYVLPLNLFLFVAAALYAVILLILLLAVIGLFVFAINK